MFRVEAVAMLACGVLLGTAARADMLDFIQSSKTLVVGVKADYKPFGFRAPSGAIAGFEPDLAADVARRFGAELKLVPVTAGNRMELLQTGKIDLIIATLTDRPDRRNAVDYIEPFYYGDFINVLLRKSAGAMNWDDLRGRTLCVTAGTIQIPVAEKLGAPMEVSADTDKSMEALAAGKCQGYLYNQSFIIGKMMEKDKKWLAEYEMPLPGMMGSPWGMAVRKGEPRFKKAMDEISADWARTGYVMQLEQKWLLPPSQFAQRFHDEYRGK